MKITLSAPIQAHGETVTELTLRDPTVRDLKEFRIGDSTVGNFIPLIAAIAGIPGSSVEQMRPSDLFAVIEAIGPLFLSPPQTGA